MKMKKIALIAMTAAAAIATPAMAQSTTVTGTINVTGTVQSKCFVLSGTGTSQTFGGDVALGELAQADGTLKASSALEAAFNGATSATINARVLCTSASPQVSVKATPLVNTAVTPDAGYTNTVNYDADVTFDLVGADETVTHRSSSANASTATLGSRLTGTGNNVAVRTSDWAATGVLVAGSYAGQIVINVAPGA